jgi:hypothetical protein
VSVLNAEPVAAVVIVIAQVAASASRAVTRLISLLSGARWSICSSLLPCGSARKIAGAAFLGTTIAK